MKIWKTDLEQRFEGIIKEIEESPVMVESKAEKAAETLLKREEAVEAIKRIEGKEADIIPPMRERVEDLQRQVVEAEDRVRDLRAEVGQAWQNAYSMDLKLESEKGANLQVLLESYDEAIDLALEFFQSELDRLRSPNSIQKHKSGVEVDLLRWKKTVRIESNILSIEVAINYCRAAIEEIEKMKFLVECPKERVTELMEKIPDIDRYDLTRIEPSLFPLSPLPPVRARSRVDRLLGR